MKLRIIILILAVSTVVSVVAGGWFYHRLLKSSLYDEARKKTIYQAEGAQARFSTYMTEQARSIRVVAGLPDIVRALAAPTPDVLEKTGHILDHFKSRLEADICYLLDRRGRCIAASNRRAKDSFVGQSYAFRPYYQSAMRGVSDIYMALGVTSGKRGVYYSSPVYAIRSEEPIGVAVIKSSVKRLEAGLLTLAPDKNEVTLVTDANGLIFIANHAQYRMKLLWPRSSREIEILSRSRQFGPGPWAWSGLARLDSHRAQDQDGKTYFVHELRPSGYPDWRVVQLISSTWALGQSADRLVRRTGFAIAIVCFGIALVTLVLYRIAQTAIARHKRVDEDLVRKNKILDGILSASPIGIGMAENRTIQWANNALVNIFGYDDQADFVGKSTRILYVSKDEYLRVGRLTYPQLEPGQTAAIDADFRRKDGTHFVGHIKISVPDPDAPRRRTLFTISDITGRVQAQKERLEREKLEGVLETAGAACHELNQPLMAIQGLCELARMEMTPDHPVAERLSKIESAVSRMGRITFKLMGIAKYKTRIYSGGKKIIDIDQASEHTNTSLEPDNNTSD